MSLYLKKRKKVLKKVFVGSSLFALGLLFTLLISALVEIFHLSSRTMHFFSPILITSVVSLLAYKPLDKLFTQFFRHYLFKHRSYAHLTLMNLAEELSLVLDLQ